MLEIQGLSIRRGRTHIVSDLSWSVRSGEHWTILGANGSGKTSLLAALTGYVTPTSGDIRLLGETYGQSDWRALRSRIGLVSSSIRQWMADDEPALETVASGRHAMIDYWGPLSREDRQKATRLLEQAGIAGLAHRPWMYLSQGERQRVLIARALMAEPELLILDEPCAGLDPVARARFLSFVQQLGSSGIRPALVLVTHHVEEIMPVFSHALLLSHGKVVASGPRSKVLNSRLLSELFEAPVKLSQFSGGLRLQVQDLPDL